MDNTRQLVKRATFGVNPFIYTNMTLEQIVDEMLVSSPYDLPIKTYSNDDYPAFDGDPDLSLNIGSTWVGVKTNSGSVKAARRSSLKFWIYKRFIENGGLDDKMLFFWQNHFGVTIENFLEPNLGWQYLKLLTDNSLGNFKTLVYKMSTEPAMLYFLNGETNIAGSTNKNYARELFELFTLGRGNYTEQDIVEASRALTGWWFDYWTGISTNEPKRHDFGVKTFSSHFKNTSFGDNGDNDLLSLINMVFETQPDVVANFIATKLYRYFINYDITPSAIEECIKPVAESFKNSGWEIKAALRTLLLCPHFYKEEFAGCQIKSPLELTVGILKEFNIKLPSEFNPPPSAKTESNFIGQFIKRTTNMGMEIGCPPDVSGWKAYYQIPDFDTLWYTTDAAISRQKFIDEMHDPWAITQEVPYMANIDVIRFALTCLPEASDPNLVIKDMNRILFPVDLPEADLIKIKTDTLLSGQAEDRYWTNAWNKFILNPEDTIQRAIVEERLSNACKYFTAQKEYQLK